MTRPQVSKGMIARNLLGIFVVAVLNLSQNMINRDKELSFQRRLNNLQELYKCVRFCINEVSPKSQPSRLRRHRRRNCVFRRCRFRKYTCPVRSRQSGNSQLRWKRTDGPTTVEKR